MKTAGIAAIAALIAFGHPGAQTPGQTRADCAACHATAHAGVVGKGKVSNARCIACHEKTHSDYDKYESFYAQGAQGVAAKPDVMFKARVSCAACHTDVTLAAHGDARMAALDRTCTNCHGTRFAGMLSRWTAGMSWRTHAVSEYVERAAQDPGLAPGAQGRLQSARREVATVKSVGPSHNLRAADALLRAALDSVKTAYALSDVPAPPAPSLGPSPERVSCVRCHYGVEESKEVVFEREFDHETHMLKGQVACARCHSEADYLVTQKTALGETRRVVDSNHGKTTLTEASCQACHHSNATKVACTVCHANDPRLTRTIAVSMSLRMRPVNAPTTRSVAFDHRLHAKTDCATCHTSRTDVRTVASCTTCHQTHHEEASRCASCHGTDTATPHKLEDHFACASCHTRQTVAMLTPNRTFCVSCHAKQADHKPDRECVTCHMQSTPADFRKRILGDTR